MTLWLRVIPLLWCAWLVYWWWSAHDVKTTARAEPTTARLTHVVPLVIAAGLISVPSTPFLGLNMRFIPHVQFIDWIAPLIVAAGLAFTIWARLHLGRNWSAIVTVKKEHELIMTGPYHLVRHPIYTGLLLAFVGSALAIGEWRGIVAVVLAAAAFWLKLKLEERWMTETFGADYTDYQRKVAALIPFIL